MKLSDIERRRLGMHNVNFIVPEDVYQFLRARGFREIDIYLTDLIRADMGVDTDGY